MRGGWGENSRNKMSRKTVLKTSGRLSVSEFSWHLRLSTSFKHSLIFFNTLLTWGLL